MVAQLFGGSQNRSHFLNYKSAQTGQVCVVLLKIISARRCDEQEQSAVRVKGSEIQKRERERECVAGKRGEDCEHWSLCAKAKGETVYDKKKKKERMKERKKACACVAFSQIKTRSAAGCYCEPFISGASGMCLPAARLGVTPAFPFCFLNEQNLSGRVEYAVRGGD